MPTFYYKAYDGTGRKRSGTVHAANSHEAHFALRETGLRPYFVYDYVKLRREIRHKRRRRALVLGLVGAAPVAMGIAALLVAYSGRERAPDIQTYAQTGFVKAAPGLIVAGNDEQRLFGSEVFQRWENFCLGAITGIEVRNTFMIVYVNRVIRTISDQEIETLATNTVRSLQRRFQVTSSSLLVVEDGETILEVEYFAGTRSTRVKWYR
jgi:hypothetical protein